MSLYQIISGPMVWISFVLFILGTLFQAIQFYPFIKKSNIRLNYASDSEPASTSLMYRFAMLKYSLCGRYPMTMSITILFHLSMFFSPFMVLGHNVLLDSALGISFPSLSPAISTLLAAIVLLCCLFFLLRRLTVPLVKSITAKEDYMMLTIATAPFLTGFMAHHQIFDYSTMIHLHILSGEIMLISIPFTKFVHMIYFIMSRFILITQGWKTKAIC